MLNIKTVMFYLFFILSNVFFFSSSYVTANAELKEFEFFLEVQSSLKWNKRFYGALIRSVIGMSLLGCVEECLYTTRCQSINYRRNLQICELNFQSANVTPESGLALDKTVGNSIIEEEDIIYGDMKYWKKDNDTLCNNIMCQINERCRLNSTNSTNSWCEISDCGFDLPYINGVSVVDGIGIGKGSHRTYSCDGFKDISSSIVCQPDGNWSRIELNCTKDLDTCNEAGYIYEESYDICYKIYYERNNWTDARNTCLSEDADLFIMDTAPRYSFIVSLNLNVSVWIGASDIENEGVWRWVDGTFFNKSTLPIPSNQVKLNNKGNRISNDTWGEADCLRFNYKKNKLFDTNCDFEREFICEN